MNRAEKMSQVSVTINRRQFRMACEEGQEEQLSDLARELDARIDVLRGKFGEIGDTRLTVMAALMVADELREMRDRIKRLEADLVTLDQARGVAEGDYKSAQALAAAALAAAADRVESVTRKINQTIGGDSGVAMG